MFRPGLLHISLRQPFERNKFDDKISFGFEVYISENRDGTIDVENDRLVIDIEYDIEEKVETLEVNMDGMDSAKTKYRMEVKIPALVGGPIVEIVIKISNNHQ